MEDILAPFATALWLGILTSISPCPLASNIAAVSFLGKDFSTRGAAVAAGLFYTLGRTLAYVGVAFIVVSGLLSVPALAQFLQHSLNRILGPLLLAVGLVLLGVVRIPTPSVGASERLLALARRGRPGTVLLGFVFALSFCPVSAALFFGSLIPLSVKHDSRLLLPAVFGIGTAAPVAVFAILIAQGAQMAVKAFAGLSRVELWARRITGGIFLLAGAYYILTYWLGVSVWQWGN